MSRRRIVERKTIEYPLTEGEHMLIFQLRDIASKMGDKPYSCLVAHIDDYFHIFECVPRGRFKNTSTTILDNGEDVEL